MDESQLTPGIEESGEDPSTTPEDPGKTENDTPVVEEEPQTPPNIDEGEPIVDEKEEKTAIEKLKDDLIEKFPVIEKVLNNEDFNNLIELAKGDKKILEILKEKYPDKFNDCENLGDFIDKVARENGVSEEELPKEYASILIAVGGVIVVVTGIGGPLGKYAGGKMIEFGYENSVILKKYLNKEDFDKVIALNRKR